VDRYATRDAELAGARIARGDLVVVSITAANRDPAVFPEPERFDLHRPPEQLRRHLAFAAGPHVCLGMHLARLEAHTALGLLLDHLHPFELAAPAAPEGAVFRKPRELRVRRVLRGYKSGHGLESVL
jgi:cytochrome P450